jgi:hypothetical protein
MANRIDQNADDARPQQRQGIGNADPGLQRSVDKAVPGGEKLPARAGENPVSQQVKKSTEQRDPQPGESTLQGGDTVER